MTRCTFIIFIKLLIFLFSVYFGSGKKREIIIIYLSNEQMNYSSLITYVFFHPNYTENIFFPLKIFLNQ